VEAPVGLEPTTCGLGNRLQAGLDTLCFHVVTPLSGFISTSFILAPASIAVMSRMYLET
jgi:hypothetical protein